MRAVAAVAAAVLALPVASALGQPGRSAHAASGRAHRATARRRSRHPSAHVAVVGGSSAAPGTYPWMAFVADASGDAVGACSGTVVSPDLVLTAAHCAEDATSGSVDAPGDFRVVTGSLDWSDEAVRQVSDVSQVLVYPGYDRLTGDGDVALLQLSTPTTAPAIALANQGEAYLLDAGTPAAIAGWGLESAGASSAPTALQQAPTILQSSGDCQQQENTVGIPFDAAAELCASDPPSDSTGACDGDSGGPLVANDVEIGVTSRGPADCGSDAPDIYAGVIFVEPWIQGWIQTLPPPTPQTNAATRSDPGSSTAPAAASSSVLPTLASSTAKASVRQALHSVFGTRFTRGAGYQPNCRRGSRTRISCAVHWTYGHDYYLGAVGAAYQLVHGTLSVSEATAVKWVSSRCYRHSARPSRCPAHGLDRATAQPAATR